MKHIHGSIEVVCGSMFSGKTDELIRRLVRATIAKQKVQVFKPAIDVRYAGQRQVVRIFRRDEVMHVFGTQGATTITELDVLRHAAEGGGEGGRLTAPMPGKVVSIGVKAGDKVTKGQPLAVMEAMKMEHTIAAPQDGVVVEVLYAPGDQVMDGAELLRLGTD